MMGSTKRDHPFVARLLAQGSELRETQMMRLARQSPTNHTGLLCNKFEMCLITHPPGSRDREQCLVNGNVGAASAVGLPGSIVTISLWRDATVLWLELPDPRLEQVLKYGAIVLTLSPP